MKVHLILIVALLASACGPVLLQTTPRAMRPMAIHTCVPGATVWLDGANVPALRDTTDANGNVTFPQFPADISAFNVHATAANLPEYGAVLQDTASTAPLIIILGSCAK